MSLTNNLLSVKENIRKKYLALKQGKIHESEDFQSTFKPIIEPLNDVKTYLESSSSSQHQQTSTGRKRKNVVNINKGIGGKKKGAVFRPKWKVQGGPDVKHNANRLKLEDYGWNEKINASDYDNEFSDGDDNLLEEEKNAYDNVEGISDQENTIDISNDYDVENEPTFTQEMFRKNYSSIPKSELDKKYGLKLNKKKQMKIGNADVSIDIDGQLSVGRMKYPRTDGLIELITKKTPQKYEEDDLQRYKQILNQSGLRNKYWRPQGRSNPKRVSGKDNKYETIISKLFEESRVNTTSPKGSPRTSGSGLYRKYRGNSKIQLVYYDDPNELVDRLRLLLASRQTGSSAHRNELISLLEELRESRIL